MKLTIEVSVESFLDFENDECDGEYLQDLIEMKVKKYAFDNSYKLNSVTESQMKFEDIAIPLYGDDGIGIAARDWLRPLVNHLKRTCKY